MTWQLDGDHALLVTDRLEAKLELSRPSQGLRRLRFEENALAAQIACVALADAAQGKVDSTNVPLAIEDAYVRGDDLIVVYAATSELPYRWQVYWRWVAAETPQLATIDLILSVQTPRLDTRPVFLVGSQTSATTAVCCDPDGRRVEGRDGRYDRQAGVAGLAALLPLAGERTLIEMVHPVDYDACQLREVEGGGLQTQWRLGESFMEKGVIRRIVVRQTFVPTDVAEEATPGLFKTWLAEDPPLTT